MSRDVQVGATVPAELADELRALAADQDRSIASLVRLAIRRLVDDSKREIKEAA